MNTTSHSPPRERTANLAVFANIRPLLRSAIGLVLQSLQKAQATIRATGVRLERGFADFADIPYQDARTRQQLSQLLDECSFKCQMEYWTHRESGIVNKLYALARKGRIATGARRLAGYKWLSAHSRETSEVGSPIEDRFKILRANRDRE
jgi:hypothetical protein